MQIMPITQIQDRGQINSKGKINYNSIKNDLFAPEIKKLSKLNDKISKEPFDITIFKNIFGEYITEITHTNGNSIKMKPLLFKNNRHSVPEFIESFINLINLKNN